MAGQRPPREKTLGQYNNQSKLVDSHWRRNKQLPDLAGSDLDFVSLGGRRTQTAKCSTGEDGERAVVVATGWQAVDGMT